MAQRNEVRSRPLLIRGNATQQPFKDSYLDYIKRTVQFYTDFFGAPVSIQRNDGTLINGEIEFGDINAPTGGNQFKPSIFCTYFYRGLYFKVYFLSFTSGYNSAWCWWDHNISFSNKIKESGDLDGLIFHTSNCLRSTGSSNQSNTSTRATAKEYNYDTSNTLTIESYFFENDSSAWVCADSCILITYGNNPSAELPSLKLIHMEYDVNPDGTVNTDKFTISFDGSYVFQDTTIAPTVTLPADILNVYNSTRPAFNSIRFVKDGDVYVVENMINRKKPVHRVYDEMVNSSGEAIFYDIFKPTSSNLEVQVFESIIAAPISSFDTKTSVFNIHHHGKDKKFIVFRFASGEAGLFKCDSREAGYYTAFQFEGN